MLLIYLLPASGLDRQIYGKSFLRTGQSRPQSAGGRSSLEGRMIESTNKEITHSLDHCLGTTRAPLVTRSLARPYLHQRLLICREACSDRDGKKTTASHLSVTRPDRQEKATAEKKSPLFLSPPRASPCVGKWRRGMRLCPCLS